MAELIKFREINDGNVRVEIWGGFVEDCGVMSVDGILSFLQNLRFISATPEEVLQEIRKGIDFDRFIEDRMDRCAFR